MKIPLVVCAVFIVCTNCTASSQICSAEQNGRVRLTNLEGIIEVCLEWRGAHMWTRLCNNQWGTVETQVVCRQLGYSESNVRHFFIKQSVDAVTADPNFTEWNMTYQCNGTESSLTSCTLTECEQTLEIIGVQCQGSRDTQSMPVAEIGPSFSISSTADGNLTPSSTVSLTSTRVTTRALFTTAQQSSLPQSTVYSTAPLAPTTTHSTRQASVHDPLSTISVKSTGSDSQALSTVGPPVTLRASPEGSQGGTSNIGTPVVYGLVSCSFIAVVLFLIIVILLAVVIKLTRTTGNEQKHNRDQESVESSPPPLDTEDTAEHHVENQLYRDPNFLTMPRNSPNSSNFHLFRNHSLRNGYESIDERAFTKKSQSQRREKSILNSSSVESQQETSSESFEDVEYSRLNIDEIDYATLEPHISQKPTRHTTPEDEEDYSHLRH